MPTTDPLTDALRRIVTGALLGLAIVAVFQLTEESQPRRKANIRSSEDQR